MPNIKKDEQEQLSRTITYHLDVLQDCLAKHNLLALDANPFSVASALSNIQQLRECEKSLFIEPSIEGGKKDDDQPSEKG